MRDYLESGLDFMRILWHGFTAKSTEEFYDTFSGYYDKFFALQGTYAEDTRRILKASVDEYGITLGTVLETGCGTGVYSAELENLCDKLHGIDFSVGQLSQAKDKDLSITLTQGNVLALPYPDENFDLITSLGMMRHLPGDMLEDYLKEAYRVLRPGGIFLAEPIPLDISTLSNPPLGKMLRKAYNAFMKWRGLDEHLGSSIVVTDALRAAGFEVEQFSSKKTYTYNVILGRKLF